jgi:hypothetical protein
VGWFLRQVYKIVLQRGVDVERQKDVTSPPQKDEQKRGFLDLGLPYKELRMGYFRDMKEFLPFKSGLPLGF